MILKILFTAIGLFFVSLTQAQQTVFEKSGGKRTATYFEIVDWYKALDKKSAKVSIKDIGDTDAGYPLQLVMVSSDGKFDPKVWHKQQKVVILINNGIHPGEPDGIDASMMLVRDIVDNKITLPENVVLGIVPIYNIGGCLNRNSTTRVNQNGPEEYGFRGNSQNLDLNRDFIKCDSKEAMSFAKLFHFLDPHIFIDNHVSDGADYQHTMTLITTQYDRLGGKQGQWLRDTFEPAIYENMKSKNWDIIPYIDFGSGIENGITMFNDAPRYSSGYAALFQTLSFMPETHMLKEYSQRVKSTYDLAVTFINEAGRQAKEIIALKNESRNAMMKQEQFPLSWNPDSVMHAMINFKGYEKSFATSEVTGQQKFSYDHSRPYSRDIKYFNVYNPGSSVSKPKAYIIPAGWHEVIDRLKANNVVMHAFKKDTLIDVQVYHITNYKSFERAYEKHHVNYNVSVSTSPEKIKCYAGDMLINTDQPACRYLVEVLEPTSADGFFAWNFFDGILYQKEWYSDYRWEPIAAEVLKNDPKLQAELARKKADDPKFAADASAILAFIYINSPYYEQAHLRFPVYRIENQ